MEITAFTNHYLLESQHNTLYHEFLHNVPRKNYVYIRVRVCVCA